MNKVCSIFSCAVYIHKGRWTWNMRYTFSYGYILMYDIHWCFNSDIDGVFFSSRPSVCRDAVNMTKWCINSESFSWNHSNTKCTTHISSLKPEKKGCKQKFALTVPTKPAKKRLWFQHQT